MIKATISPVFPEIFDVEEKIQVYRRSMAILFEHILNHLKALSVLDMGIITPGLERACREVHGWSKEVHSSDMHDATQRRLVDVKCQLEHPHYR